METTRQSPVELIYELGALYGYPINHITYDERVTDEFDFYLTSSSVHEGTLLFTYALLVKILGPLIDKSACKQGDEERHQQAGDVQYTVGDLIHKVEHDVLVRDEFPGMRDEFRIMVKCQYS